MTDKKNSLTMLIGVPGSGKSTFIKNMPHFEKYVILSTDNYIELKAKENNRTYNEEFPHSIKDAETQMYKDLEDAIANGKSIIWDQTNLTKKTRAKKLTKIPDHYDKMAFFFNVPDDLNERLASRPGKTIPVYVINNMIETIEKPGLDEGFHLVFVENV